jgi:DNA-binding SARP family transcriptional activator
MRFRILGSLEVHTAGGWVHIRAAQQRVVLAVLLAEAGQTVSTDRLVDAVWADTPPRTATNTIVAYVVRLRRLLGDPDGAVLVTRGRGYQVAADDDLDAVVFEQLVATGRNEWKNNRPETAEAALAQALALWRGPVFADVPASPLLTNRAAYLEQVRLASEEDHVATLLAMDRHTEAVETLYRLVEQNPLRERRWEHLVHALAQHGQRSQALDTFHRARRVLRDELGLEPGSELRRLQQAILRGHVTPAVTSPRPPVRPAQLPADVPTFIGRDSQLARLHALAGGWESQPAAPTRVVAITGAAGVGKTALAVHWAHQVRDLFGDGQLYANLRGLTDDSAPLPPVAVLGRFLRALNHPPERIPSDVDEASALFRSLLTGKNMLVLLDNARDSDQVRPLVPGSPGCLALVTSRDRLDGLITRDSATPLALPALTDTEALALLTGLLGGNRMPLEQQAMAELAALCGHLPLALRLAAGNVVTHQHSIPDYVRRLRDDRLGGLQMGPDGVRPAFDLSYMASTDAARRLFRLLSLVPGPDFTASAAGAIVDTEPASAHLRLDELTASYLVHEHAPGRYCLHDLLRCYAAERSNAEDSDAERVTAIERLHNFYQRQIDAAANRLYPEILRLPGHDLAEVVFDDDSTASAWLDAERTNLVAAIRHAAVHGPHPAAWRLADSLRGYFFRRMFTTEWQMAVQAGVAAAELADNACALAASYLSLGGLYSAREHHHDAIHHYARAMACAQRAGWRQAEAAALSSIGMAHVRLGELHTAAGFYTRSIAMRRNLDCVAGQAMDLDNLGLIYFGLGQLELAEQYHQQAGAFYQRAGARTAHARANGALGVTYHAMGRVREARQLLSQAVTVLREAGDRYNLGFAYTHLARVCSDLGDDTGALDMARAAHVVARDTSDLTLEGWIHAVLAGIHHKLGDHRRAIDGYERAAHLVRQGGDRFRETEILIHWAETHYHVGQADVAARLAQDALDLARQGRYRLLEGRALALLGQTDNKY